MPCPVIGHVGIYYLVHVYNPLTNIHDSNIDRISVTNNDNDKKCVRSTAVTAYLKSRQIGQCKRQ